MMEDSENPTEALNREFAKYTSMTADQLKAELEKVEAEKQLVDEKWRAAARGTPERSALRTERLACIHRKDKIESTMEDRRNGIEPTPAYSSSSGSEADVQPESKDGGNDLDDPSTENAEATESSTAEPVQAPEKLGWIDVAAALLESMMEPEQTGDLTSSIPLEGDSNSAATHAVMTSDESQPKPEEIESKMDINRASVNEPVKESPTMKLPSLSEAPAVQSEPIELSKSHTGIGSPQASIKEGNSDPNNVSVQVLHFIPPPDVFLRLVVPLGLESRSRLQLSPSQLSF